MSLRAKILRMKTAVFLRLQPLLLATFGRAPAGSLLSRTIRRFSRFTVGPIPCVIKLDITNRCNIRCEMCYAPHRPIDLEFGTIARLLDRFESLPLRLDLMGGEPLAHPRLADIIRYAKKKTGIRQVNIYTNATLAGPEYARALKDAGLDAAMVNLSSDDAALHDAFTRTPGSWEKTVAGIGAMKDAGIEVFAFVVLHKQNISRYTGIRRFALDVLGVKPVWYHWIPSGGNSQLMEHPDEWAETKHRILYADDPAHRETITGICTFCGRICLGAYYSYSVKVTGELTPCPFISDLVLGNVFEDDVWELLAHAEENGGYRTFLSPPEECRGCAYERFCGGGCRAGNADAGGNYTLRDIRCTGRKKRFRRNAACDDVPTFF